MPNDCSRTLVALLLALTGGVCAARAEVPAAPLTIRVYDGAAVDPATRRAAIETAAAILAASGMPTTWSDCTGDALSPRCALERGSRELMVRIVPALAPPVEPRHGSAVVGAAAGTSRQMLGFAVVPPAGTGVLATIFMDRVRATAERTAVETPVLLGRAIAHEIGHLLLGTSAHTDRGLMREVWTDAELAGNRAEDWLFSRAPDARSAR